MPPCRCPRVAATERSRDPQRAARQSHDSDLRPSDAALLCQHRTGKNLTTFRELGVHPEIAHPLMRANIVTPFPIHQINLSVALMGPDLLPRQKTGTGKTLAFGIPVPHPDVAQHDPDFE